MPCSWIPAFAGMTLPRWLALWLRALDSRLRGNDGAVGSKPVTIAITEAFKISSLVKVGEVRTKP